MLTAKVYGVADWGWSSCATTMSVRSLRWYDNYADALNDATRNDSAGLIIDKRKPCRLCGGKYSDPKHLIDGKVYDFSDWNSSDQMRHWFID